MKKLLPLLVGMLLISYSCKKTNTVTPVNPGFYGTVNGVKKAFNTGAEVQRVNAGTGGNYSFQFSGVTSDTCGLVINISSQNPITKGTYAVNGINVNGVGPFFSYYSTTNGAAGIYITGAAPYTGTVTITSLSSTNVQGTFNGSLYETNPGNTARTTTITNGTFNLNF